MLDELFDPTPKIGTELVHGIRVYVRPVMIRQLGKRHPVEPRGLGDLLDRHTPALPKFEIGDSLLEFES